MEDNESIHEQERMGDNNLIRSHSISAFNAQIESFITKLLDLHLKWARMSPQSELLDFRLIISTSAGCQAVFNKNGNMITTGIQIMILHLKYYTLADA